MQFTKKVLYLGYKSMTLKDGAVLNSITFFDAEDQDTVQVNVAAANQAVTALLSDLAFGSPCNATFGIRNTVDKQSGKSYLKLSLAGLSPIPTK